MDLEIDIEDQKTLLDIRRIADDHGAIIIEDMTQSLFSEHEVIGDYIVASARKWMAVHQGGILYTGQKGSEGSGLYAVRCFDDSECPLVYPIRVRDRGRFRRYLIENRIYCAVHWPFDGIKEEQRSNAKINAETMLSLPTDQRYGSKEIDHMLEVIHDYGGVGFLCKIVC